MSTQGVGYDCLLSFVFERRELLVVDYYENTHKDPSNVDGCLYVFLLNVSIKSIFGQGYPQYGSEKNGNVICFLFKQLNKPTSVSPKIYRK